MEVLLVVCVVLTILCGIVFFMAVAGEVGELALLSFLLGLIFGFASMLIYNNLDPNPSTEEQLEEVVKFSRGPIEKGLELQRNELQSNFKIKLGVYEIQTSPANQISEESDSILISWGWTKDSVINSYKYRE